jgi:hypothetical protein
MPERPLLILPPPGQPDERTKRSVPPPKLHFPPTGRQGERLGPRFRILEEAFEAKRTQIQTDPTGIVPEEVLVLETVGSVSDFMMAVRNVPGLEWMAEVEEEDIPPDEDFYDPKREAKPLSRHLYLLFSNIQALNELLALWRSWQAEQTLPHGKGKWRQVFTQLRDVRRWGVKDRLEDTGVLDDWRGRVEHNEERVRGEIELWFRQNEEKRRIAQSRVVRLLEAAGGRMIRVSTIEDISYHAILADFPIATVRQILAAEEIELVQCEQIQFFRATSQMAAIVDKDEVEPEEGIEPPGPVVDVPVAALLDGVPLQNHQRLIGRVILDDPDGLEAAYGAGERLHGTGMASLILHGDLEASEGVLERKLYIRPIFRPDPRARDFGLLPCETVSEDELVVDLLHRALRRIYEGDGEEPAAAPSIRVINLSIGILDRPFENMLSPLARLIDWLSWKYNVLFIVSAGNRLHDVVLDVPRDSFRNQTPAQIQEHVLKSLAGDGRNRRLLSPAESVNCLTVGAVHSDCSHRSPANSFIDPFVDESMPSPINAHGLGFRRAIKPEVLHDGGRVLYREKPGGEPDKVVCSVVRSGRPPGQRIAAPGPGPGDLAFTCFSRGTSNAAALVTRAAVKLYDVLQELREEPGGEIIDVVPEAVWLKTLLIHTADWGSAFDVLDRELRTPDNSRKFREYATRVLGYGGLHIARAASCSPSRATVLSGGQLEADQVHVHRIPLPPALSGVRGWRRLTITLAWFTPVNPRRQEWRRAQLWFEPARGEDDRLGVDRRQADWTAVKRGTAQHEILDGQDAKAFVDGDVIEIRVNCRAGAGELDEAVPYAMVISLEVAEELGVPIYQQVRERVQARIRVTPRP